MQQFKDILDEIGFKTRFHEFHNLMPYRIREILLVSSLYDSFILEEDGQFYEKIMSEYHDLNLSQAPIITRVSSGQEALEMARNENRFDLIITTLNLGDMEALAFTRTLREAGSELPVALLTYDNRELNELMARYDTSVFEKVFMWQGDFRILLSIVKCIEDAKNVAPDTEAIGVQSIIVVEDNVNFYSSYLPLIYTELFRHSQNLISEGVSVSDKLLRMRARPKILLCSTYEEAMNYYTTYEDCILGVISDIAFPRKGIADPKAGIRFARKVKESHFDIPILLQSNSPGMEKVAEELGASFLMKSSPMLLDSLRRFMKVNFAFGDFIFCLPEGKVVGHAGDLRSLEKLLGHIPGDSIRFHAERNHFSNWLKARTEFWLAHRLRPHRVGDFQSLDHLRQHLIDTLREGRIERGSGIISDFNPEQFDSSTSFSRLGGGSLGGKARGLAFTSSLLASFKIHDRFEGIKISVPQALVLGTDVFDQFLEENDLRDFAMSCEDDQEITWKFMEARFPEAIKLELGALLEMVQVPLAIRSSSLLEDSRYMPFAGVYKTIMLSNSHKDMSNRLDALIRAIKQVYASTFLKAAKAYIRATHYRLEEEKMAVIIQKLVGAPHDDRFYPDFAGVARSENFYPHPPMASSDGIVSVGLGLGKMVVEGGHSVRFCPKYPTHPLQFGDTEDVFEFTQREFYALSLDAPDVQLNPFQEDGLIKCALSVAEGDHTLGSMASTFSPENQTLTEGTGRPGVRIITFAPILQSKVFPLHEILQLIMEMGQWGMSSPVEVEFAVNLCPPPGEPKEFGILQVRPLVKSREMDELVVDDVAEEEVLCQCPQVLGNGVIDTIYDVVWVDPERFDRSKSKETAMEVGEFNQILTNEKRPYLLIGMGRWGSSDSWLGIPASWDQICGARVIVETGFKDFKVVPSQGTHFFQNLISFQIGYFTVNAYSQEGTVDWQWLAEQAGEVKTYTRHIRLQKPIIVRMNGRENRGVIIKPAL